MFSHSEAYIKTCMRLWVGYTYLYVSILPQIISVADSESCYRFPAILAIRIYCDVSWRRHQMETFSALLAICAGNSPATGEFPAQRPVTRSFDVFFALRLNKRLSKQSWGWLFETPSCPLWRHCNDSSICRWNHIYGSPMIPHGLAWGPTSFHMILFGSSDPNQWKKIPSLCWYWTNRWWQLCKIVFFSIPWLGRLSDLFWCGHVNCTWIV